MNKHKNKEFEHLPMYLRKVDGTRPTAQEVLTLTEQINKKPDPKAEFFKAWKEKRDEN